MTKHFGIVFVVMCAISAFGQDVKQQSFGNNSPNIANAPVAPVMATTPNDIVVNPSPAEDALVEMAKQMESTTKAYNDLMQQARTSLDVKNKPILDEMKVRAKKWQDKIEAENKDLKAKLDKNQADAIDQFNKEVAGLQSKAVSPQTITALEQVVKKEQNLPETAHFDSQRKVWVDPAKK